MIFSERQVGNNILVSVVPGELLLEVSRDTVRKGCFLQSIVKFLPPSEL